MLRVWYIWYTKEVILLMNEEEIDYLINDVGINNYLCGKR